jgi:Zn-dependent M16 (insulinase) family peptidase
MTRFIIGTVAGLDVPRTASQRGNLALENYFSGRTREEDQKLRDEVLSTTLEDLHELQPMVKEVMDQKNWCVYGNEEKIQANRELFGSVRNVVE